MENHAKYGDSIYFHKGDSLFVNLFIASQLDWKEKGVRIVQETVLPESDRTRLTFTCAKPTSLTVQIRRPAWSGKQTTVSVNGKAARIDARPDGYITLKRTWKTNDTIEVHFDMSVYTESMPDDENRIAFLFGPIVLAGDFGTTKPEPWIPVLMTDDADVSNWLKPVQTAPRTTIFKTRGVGRPGDVTFVPFYSLHHRYYSVYFDKFTKDQWADRQAEYEKQLRLKAELVARTVDFLQPGQMQPERDHDLDGEKTRTGSHQDRKWRDASDGGHFAFDMKVSGDKPLDLVCTYWGGDSGGRKFDIIVDGKVIATQTLNRSKPGKFFDVTYPLPVELTKGKQKIRIKLQAHPGKMAGGLFACRIVKRTDSK